jgi:hypothetical protein
MNSETSHMERIKAKEGNAFVFRNALKNLENPDLKNRMQALDFDPSLFKDLMTLDPKIKWTGEPVEMDYPPDKPTEHIIIRIAQTKEGKDLEVTEVTAYAPDTMKTRLRNTPEKSIGFEAILLKEGSITYDILHGFEPIAAGVCMGSEEHTSVELKPGDLLIIPRPVARQITEVERGSKSIYLSDPWKHDEPQDIL